MHCLIATKFTKIAARSLGSQQKMFFLIKCSKANFIFIPSHAEWTSVGNFDATARVIPFNQIASTAASWDAAEKNNPCYQLSQQNCLNQAKSQLHWNVFAPVLDSCPFQGDIIVSWDHGTIDPTPNEKNLQIPRWMQLSITDQHCPLFPKINLSHRDKQEKGFTQHWTTICNSFRSPDTNPMPFAFSCKIHES